MTRRKKIVLGLVCAKTFLFGSSPFLYLALLFGPQAQFFSIDPWPRTQDQTPGRRVGGEYRIIDEARLDPVDRIALAGGLFLGDLSDLIIFRAACFDPRHALRLTGFDVAVCVHCGGIVRWSITGESYTGIGPLGGPVWEWVRKRHNLKPPDH